ncbi:MAG: hypothetical protein K8H86_09260 [Ignavibacteriaceae bacterium]|nr:hypothetical protein [Ignavibacteriaceae bacterium]
MKNSEKNKLNMYGEVLAVMDANSVVYTDTPIVGETLEAFRGKTREIKEIDSNFFSRTKAETMRKEIAEEKLTAGIVKLASALFVLGNKTGNTDLIVNAKLTRTSLEAMRDIELVDKCENILSLVSEHKAELVPYGITDEYLTTVQGIYTEFNSAINDRSDERADSIAAREKLTRLFNEADRMLKNELDPLIEIYFDVNPDFCNAYKAARVIKDTAASHKLAAPSP